MLACRSHTARLLLRHSPSSLLTRACSSSSSSTATHLLDLPRRRPFAFGVTVSAVKTAAADYIAQTVIERREQLDRRRSLLFFLWGAGYLGGVQYFVYVHLFTRLLFPSAAAFAAKPLRAKLADPAGIRTMLSQVGLDQFVHHPFVLFPCFYTVKEFVQSGGGGGGGGGGGPPSPERIVASAMRKYQQNLREDCLVCWKIWVPTFVVNFSFCPIWARVPFVAVVSFGFMTYWSLLRGEPIRDEGEPVDVSEPGR